MPYLPRVRATIVVTRTIFVIKRRSSKLKLTTNKVHVSEKDLKNCVSKLWYNSQIYTNHQHLVLISLVPDSFWKTDHVGKNAENIGTEQKQCRLQDQVLSQNRKA